MFRQFHVRHYVYDSEKRNKKRKADGMCDINWTGPNGTDLQVRIIYECIHNKYLRRQVPVQSVKTGLQLVPLRERFHCHYRRRQYTAAAERAGRWVREQRIQIRSTMFGRTLRRLEQEPAARRMRLNPISQRCERSVNWMRRTRRFVKQSIAMLRLQQLHRHDDATTPVTELCKQPCHAIVAAAAGPQHNIGCIYISICSLNLTIISLSHLSCSHFVFNSKYPLNMQTNNENTTKTIFINVKFCRIAV